MRLLVGSNFVSVVYYTNGKRKRQTKEGKEKTQKRKEER